MLTTSPFSHYSLTVPSLFSHYSFTYCLLSGLRERQSTLKFRLSARPRAFNECAACVTLEARMLRFPGKNSF